MAIIYFNLEVSIFWFRFFSIFIFPYFYSTLHVRSTFSLWSTLFCPEFRNIVIQKFIFFRNNSFRNDWSFTIPSGIRNDVLSWMWQFSIENLPKSNVVKNCWFCRNECPVNNIPCETQQIRIRVSAKLAADLVRIWSSSYGKFTWMSQNPHQI
jgi:hypothetical protein